MRRSVVGLAVLASVHACAARCPPVAPCAVDDRCIPANRELHDPSSVALAGCTGSRWIPPRCATAATGATVAAAIRTGVNAQVVTVVGPLWLDTHCAGIPQKCWSEMFLVDPADGQAAIALLRAQADGVVPFACRGDVTAVCCELPADRRSLLVIGTFRAAPTVPPTEQSRAGVVVSSVCTVE
jgi:hypothetical protein